MDGASSSFSSWGRWVVTILSGLRVPNSGSSLSSLSMWITLVASGDGFVEDVDGWPSAGLSVAVAELEEGVAVLPSSDFLG